jgi:hypothetical protein
MCFTHEKGPAAGRGGGKSGNQCQPLQHVSISNPTESRKAMSPAIPRTDLVCMSLGTWKLSTIRYVVSPSHLQAINTTPSCGQKVVCRSWPFERSLSGLLLLLQYHTFVPAAWPALSKDAFIVLMRENYGRPNLILPRCQRQQ